MELNKIYKQYPKQEDCIKHLEFIYWDNVPTCPYCNSVRKTDMKYENRYHCNDCRTSYSVTAKTIFHKTKVDLQKWFYVIHLTLATKTSARQVSKLISVTKDTACFMVNRINSAYKVNSNFLNKFIQL